MSRFLTEDEVVRGVGHQAGIEGGRFLEVFHGLREAVTRHQHTGQVPVTEGGLLPVEQLLGEFEGEFLVELQGLPDGCFRFLETASRRKNNSELPKGMSQLDSILPLPGEVGR
jgi:hypothetical protein